MVSLAGILAPVTRMQAMWTASHEKLPGDRGLRFVLKRADLVASFGEVVHAWRDSEAFRSFFNGLLAQTPYSAMRWETPAVTTATASQPFECVVLDSPRLARHPDPKAFAEHFLGDGPRVVRIANLGGDAVMVVPRPLVQEAAYGHLAAFVRQAPERQRDDLWRCVGEAMVARMSARPVWLSTAGAGVSWLHVRLDDRPKYYGHGPYRQGVGRVAEVMSGPFIRRRRRRR